MTDPNEVPIGLQKSNKWAKDRIAAIWHGLSPRELATVLAALRLWQVGGERSMLVGAEQAEAIEDIASDCGKHKPLDEDEIDALCERINS